MQVELIKPCPESVRLMRPIIDGYDCLNCKQVVIDYSDMSDSQMLTHIQKHGLGCGEWRTDQLNRDLKLDGKCKLNFKLFYTMLISSLWLRPSEATAQAIPIIIEQMPTKERDSGYQQSQDTVPVVKEVIISTNSTSRKFGTGNVSVIIVYKQIPFTPIYIRSKHKRGSWIKLGRWCLPRFNKNK